MMCFMRNVDPNPLTGNKSPYKLYIHLPFKNSPDVYSTKSDKCIPCVGTWTVTRQTIAPACFRWLMRKELH